MLRTAVVSLLLLIASFLSAAEPDILLADFEGETYGDWHAMGEAFGTGPAKGTLTNQMPVSGFRGKGLVNSYRGGDGPTGKLMSPEITLARRYLAFLIGGGGYAGKTCINLVVEGKVVRTAAGPNTQPGGSEELEPAAWDLGDLAGKKARIEIVDDATGGWGHINIDHIALTDTKPDLAPATTTREIELAEQYLHFPVKTGDGKGPRVKVAVSIDGAVVREFDIELSDRPDWFAHLDVSAWKGKRATITSGRLPAGSKALDLMTQSDTIWAADRLYREPLRPQLHFSPRRGWNNDPNGMVYAQGEYHLYFQHNPYGWHWGNMHWGHAVSKDLVHWEELPIALYPRRHGDWVFSGSAVVDKANTSGWRKGDNELLVGAYTSTGRGECIVYSNDRGRTWTEYEKNPVVKHQGRDPRLLWHEPSRQWVMAVYTEAEGKQWIAFHTSPDLKAWTYQSRIDGFFECPDLFELPLPGKPGEKRWVLTAADSGYRLGTFDGKAFKPETPKLKGHSGAGFYAAQTFTSDPQGRVIQIGWFQTNTPGMPFNQSMTLPLELSLTATPDGPRLAWSPVKELAALRTKTTSRGPGALAGGEKPLTAACGELVEIECAFEPEATATFELVVRGVRIVYDAKRQIIVNEQRAAAPLRDGKQKIRVYVDRVGLEVFASDGVAYVPMPITPAAGAREITVAAQGGMVKVTQFDVHDLKSIWQP